MKKLILIVCTALITGGVCFGQTNLLLEQKVKLNLKGKLQKETSINKNNTKYKVGNFTLKNKDFLTLMGSNTKNDIILKTWQTWWTNEVVNGTNLVKTVEPWIWQQVVIRSGTADFDVTDELGELLSTWPISFVWEQVLGSGGVDELLKVGALVKGTVKGDNLTDQGNITVYFTDSSLEGDIPHNDDETEAVETKETWEFAGVAVDAKFNAKANSKKNELKINNAKHTGNVTGWRSQWTHTPGGIDAPCPEGSEWVFQFGICSSETPSTLEGKYTVNGKSKVSLSDVTPPPAEVVPLP